MIVGIALQAWARVAHSSKPEVVVQQTMLFPTISTAFARTLSTEHPRTPWRSVPYAPTGDLWGNKAVSDFLRATRWESRASAPWDWRLTHDATLFPMTDQDYGDLVGTHELPRNVGLRYARALEARGAVLIGSGAKLPTDLAYDFPVMTRELPGDTVADKLAALVEACDQLVETRALAGIEALIPETARAKAAGVLKNRRMLGMSEPTPPSAGWTAPVPVAAPTAPAPAPAPAPAAAAAPEPVVAAPTPVAPGDKLRRPNGQVYVARRVDLGDNSISDVEMFRRGLVRGWCSLAYGEPGTGKTAAFEVAFPGMITMLGTAETTADDFIGGYVQTGPDSYEWVDGDLVVAMENGQVLFVDEIGLIDTRQLSVLYSVMDGRREINVTSNPQRGKVTAVDGFGVVAATNPHAPGVRLSEALLSRCQIQLEVKSDYKIAAGLGVPARAVQAAEHLAKLRDNQEVSWAPEMRDLLAFQENENEFGVVFALRALIAAAPEMDREVVQTHLRERWGDLRNATKLIRALSVD
jgi:nitric oxide reductase NorQ protein